MPRETRIEDETLTYVFKFTTEDFGVVEISINNEPGVQIAMSRTEYDYDIGRSYYNRIHVFNSMAIYNVIFDWIDHYSDQDLCEITCI